MDLLGVRTQFVKLSGRYDLVDDPESFADNGADFFIQSGQKFLDGLIRFPGEAGELNSKPASGTYYIDIPGTDDPRSIVNVRIADADSMADLVRASLRELRDLYGAKPGLANVDVGKPIYWAYEIGRDITTPTLATESRRRIVIAPPTDGTWTIYIQGSFFSAPLVSNTDVSYWSAVYPHTLIQAALYMMERFYRNTTGMRDHLEAIRGDVALIDFDQVEEALSDIDQLANSW